MPGGGLLARVLVSGDRWRYRRLRRRADLLLVEN